MEHLSDALRRVDGEQFILWMFLVIAGYMFVLAGQFDSSARLFPRLASGVVLVAGGLQLAVRHLDINIERSESIVLSGSQDEETDEVPEGNVSSVIVLGLLVTGYILAGFVVGLLWPTPAFVLAYLLYSGQPKWKVALLTVLTTAIAYGFMTIMNLDLATGGF